MTNDMHYYKQTNKLTKAVQTRDQEAIRNILTTHRETSGIAIAATQMLHQARQNCDRYRLEYTALETLTQDRDNLAARVNQLRQENQALTKKLKQHKEQTP